MRHKVKLKIFFSSNCGIHLLRQYTGNIIKLSIKSKLTIYYSSRPLIAVIRIFNKLFFSGPLLSKHILIYFQPVLRYYSVVYRSIFSPFSWKFGLRYFYDCYWRSLKCATRTDFIVTHHNILMFFNTIHIVTFFSKLLMVLEP